MSSTSSIDKQPLNKGKGKMGEEHEEANLHRSKEMVLDQGLVSKNQDKGKEIIMDEEPKASRDKQKAIMEEEPEDASEDSKYPKIFGVIMKPTKGKRKAGYSCGFCDKTFINPQALGGHQNGHKWERNLKERIQAIRIAMGGSSYCEFSSLPTLPSYKSFGGNQYNGLDGTFQHAGITSFGAGTMYGALETRNNSVFPYPRRAIGNNTSTFQHRLSVGFNAGFGTNSSIGHGAFHNPLELEWFNLGFGTNNYGRVENVSGLHRPTNEAGETQQGGKPRSDFVLPRRNQVTRSKIDFGLLPKRNGEDTETQLVEASKIDLTFKL